MSKNDLEDIKLGIENWVTSQTFGTWHERLDHYVEFTKKFFSTEIIDFSYSEELDKALEKEYYRMNSKLSKVLR